MGTWNPLLAVASLVGAVCLSVPPALGQQENAPRPPAPKRPWGPEQATGEPDTFAAGDMTTAWASQMPDGGPEWLRVEYEKAVPIAEVRIRETCGPGAITKVTAIPKEGEEALLWEGREPDHDFPGNFVVFADKDKELVAKVVKIYLDTRLAPGWNEIDAVQLLAKDGTGQWAARATASSFFGEQAFRHPVFPVPQQFAEPDPFVELGEVAIKVRLEGNETIEGIFLRSRGEFIVLRQPAAGKTFIVSKRKIVLVEVADRLP